MNVRKYSAGIAASALLASGLALTAMAPATADPVGDPSATDIVGVGSDTIEFVVGDLANAWNTSHPNQKIASFDATPQPSTIVLRSGHTAVARPNGSGQGKATLFGAGNNVDVNFARSSSTLSTAEQAELTQYPFAVDGLKMAVSGNTPSNAPASLTIAQIVDIYKGTYKKWSDINPSFSGSFINPKIPQSGSGTRSFFEAELKAANGGVAVVYPAAGGGYSGVTEVQEHNADQIQGDPNAIAPFSTARAQTLTNPSVIKFEPGYSAKRAVYNVVRNADTGSQWVTDIFGTGGFFCSTAGKAIIEARGFAQLATVANGGVCGQGTTTAVSNFTTNTVTTSTSIVASAPAPGRKVTLTATVAADGQNADGDLDFFEGGNKVGSGVLTGGQATLNLSNVTPGSHIYTAKFTSGNPAAFTDSVSGEANVTVKEVAVVGAVANGITYGKAGVASVTITSPAGVPTGNVTAKLGSVVLGTKALDGTGKAAFTVPASAALTAGTKVLNVTYAGDTANGAGTLNKNVVVAKASNLTVAETFPAKVAKGKKGKGTVTVAIAGSTLKAAGSIVIKQGSKVVGKGTLVNGKVTITLAKLKKGKKTLTIVYGGSANTVAKVKTFTITQK
ncbi:ABC-type phosphate transport system substrate-binding protein [Marmoricola sp. OAE513]|uniref:Ig-like domain repeat protein n=1 Tax=Marmoricola sp. OAE513 TaxID=2817894 RepID=UPI001AE1D5FD